MDLRHVVVIALIVFVAGGAPAAGAQPVKNAPRIGVLSPSEPLYTAVEVFRRGLQELGYTESTGTRLEYRSSEGHDDRFPALAADLVSLKVDVIVAATPPAIRAAQWATTSIPIVMLLSGDPVRSGLIKSLARPGGNTTGVATLTYDLSPKRLELFKECVPHVKDIAVLVNPVYPGVREALSEMVAAGPRLGLRVHAFEVQEPGDFDRAFMDIIRARADGLVVEPSPLTSTQMGRIIEFAATNRLPAMDARKDFPQRGGLMAYGIDYGEHVRAGLRYVDKLLKGARPGELPVEQPTKFALAINLKTAKALGLAIPRSVLLRADEVIQ